MNRRRRSLVIDKKSPRLEERQGLDVNIQSERSWVPGLGRTVRLRVSARGIKVIEARGIEAVVADLRRARGRL